MSIKNFKHKGLAELFVGGPVQKKGDRYVVVEQKRRPSNPGDILVGLFLKDRKVSLTAFADAIEYPRKHLTAVVQGKTRIDADLATRMGMVLGTSAEIWLNLQNAIDLWDAKQKLKNWKPARTFFGVSRDTRGGDTI